MKNENDKACGLDMPAGLHDVNYPQKFVRAPKSQFPSDNKHHGRIEHAKIMSHVKHAK